MPKTIISDIEILGFIKRSMVDKKLWKESKISAMVPSDTLKSFFDGPGDHVDLDYVELIMIIERQYNISLPDEQCNTQVTFQDLIDDIKRCLE